MDLSAFVSKLSLSHIIIIIIVCNTDTFMAHHKVNEAFSELCECVCVLIDFPKKRPINLLDDLFSHRLWTLSQN